MTTTERPKLAPVVCEPWCAEGNGHTDTVFRQDQSCMGEWHTNLAADPGEDQAEVAVLPWRGVLRTKPDVCMNVSIDGDVHMTVGQARALIEALEMVISIVEGTESHS